MLRQPLLRQLASRRSTYASNGLFGSPHGLRLLKEQWVRKNSSGWRRFTTTNGGGKANKEEVVAGSADKGWIGWFLGPKPMPPRGTLSWYREMVLVCTVFAITGTSTMVLVRPAMSEILGLKGSLKEGPWSYRICSIVIMTPLYAGLLVTVGTVFGRHSYFRHFAVKMFQRFGIPPEMLDKTFHETSKTFRKW